MCNIPECVYYPCKELSADNPWPCHLDDSDWAVACQVHLEWLMERDEELSE